jgi:hypothetical protein
MQCNAISGACVHSKTTSISIDLMSGDEIEGLN